MIILKIRALLILACCAMLFTFDARALTIDTPTQAEKAYYTISYSGMNVGKIWLWWEANEEHYKLTSLIKTAGMARMFTKKERNAELIGTHADNNLLVPLYYTETVTYPHKQRVVNISYDSGIMSSVVSEPPSDVIPAKNQLVSTLDPLSLLLTLIDYSQNLHNADAAFVLNMFDGKRLQRIHAAEHIAQTDHCSAPCVALTLRRDLLLGYDKDDIERHAKGEPPLIMTHDSTLSRLPQSLSVVTRFGTVRITRQNEE